MKPSKIIVLVLIIFLACLYFFWPKTKQAQPIQPLPTPLKTELPRTPDGRGHEVERFLKSKRLLIGNCLRQSKTPLASLWLSLKWDPHGLFSEASTYPLLEPTVTDCIGNVIKPLKLKPSADLKPYSITKKIKLK